MQKAYHHGLLFAFPQYIMMMIHKKLLLAIIAFAIFVMSSLHN